MIYHQHGEDFGGERNTLDDLQEAVDAAVETLQRNRDDFDGIIVRGLSGVTLGVPVALALRVPIVIVRSQPSDVAHSTAPVGAKHLKTTQRWLFLDDFVSMGVTREACGDVVREHGGEIVLTYQSKYDSLAKGALL